MASFHALKRVASVVGPLRGLWRVNRAFALRFCRGGGVAFFHALKRVANVVSTLRGSGPVPRAFLGGAEVLDADALFGFGELDEYVVAFDFSYFAGAEGFVADGLARLEDWLRLGRDFGRVRG